MYALTLAITIQIQSHTHSVASHVVILKWWTILKDLPVFAFHIRISLILRTARMSTFSPTSFTIQLTIALDS